MSPPVEDVFYPNAFREEDGDAKMIALLAKGLQDNKVLLDEARSELTAARTCIRSRSVLRDFVRRHFGF